MNEYRDRVVDKMLRDELSIMGAVVVEGAKWCGKTTTAEQAAASIVYIDEEGKTEENILLARTAPERILNGSFPRQAQSVPTLRQTSRSHLARLLSVPM